LFQFSGFFQWKAGKSPNKHSLILMEGEWQLYLSRLGTHPLWIRIDMEVIQPVRVILQLVLLNSGGWRLLLHPRQM
jgi:hypothetical protein